MSIYTTITASLPFIEVDLNLTPQQMFMFINGLKYILPCQRRFSSNTLKQRVSEQYQTTEAFHALQCILLELQSKQLPLMLETRVQREHKIVQSIQSLLRNRSDIVIRRTDKSKVFYIGNATDFAGKAEEYMLKTNACQEVQNSRCPLSDMLYAV
ncbi:unnamed protein product [Rotaria sp. Silwood2]|nr:unnamed protein product [Rotaria sp. Silwood2]